MSRTLSIIIPCYNEAQTIAQVVDRVVAAPLPPGWDKEILVVDDGSSDGTPQALATLVGVRTIIRPHNGGKGAAVKSGLREASGELCVVQDADLELNPDDIQALLAPVAAGEARAAFGYRVLAPGAVAPGAFWWGGKAISFLYNVVFGTNFKDVPCGYKLFSREYIPDLLACPSDDFVFDAFEMTRVIASQGGGVVQVPVRYTPRSRAQGKKIRAMHGIYTALAILFIRAGIHKDPVPQELARLMRYGAVGVCTVAINLAIFWMLTDMGLWYEFASTAAFVLSYAANFILHKFWTFRSFDPVATKRQLPLHFGLALVNLGVNALLLYILVAFLHVPEFLAQVCTLVFVAAESFFLLSRYVFNI